MQELETIASPLGNINPTEYTISIGPRPGGYCFSLYTPKQHRYDGLFAIKTESADALLKNIEERGIRLEQFSHVFLLDESKRWTLLPSNMAGIDPDNLWKLNFGSAPKTCIERTNIVAANATCLFEPTGKNLQLRERLANATIVPIVATDIAYTIKSSLNTRHKFLGMDVRDRRTNLYIADKGKLEMANGFNTECAADSLYFAMNAIRTFQLDQAETQTELWGYLPEGLDNTLKQYLKEVKIAEPGGDATLSTDIEKTKNKHEYFELINPTICEL